MGLRSSLGTTEPLIAPTGWAMPLELGNLLLVDVYKKVIGIGLNIRITTHLGISYPDFSQKKSNWANWANAWRKYKTTGYGGVEYASVGPGRG